MKIIISLDQPTSLESVRHFLAGTQAVAFQVATIPMGTKGARAPLLLVIKQTGQRSHHPVFDEGHWLFIRPNQTADEVVPY